MHIYTALPFSLLLPLPFFSLCHTHTWIPPPPPFNKSLLLPAPCSHSLDTIVKQLKHSGSIKDHIIHVGGAEDCNWKSSLAESYERDWEDGRVSSRRKKTARCPNCRLIAMRILYYTSQPLINKWLEVNMVLNVHRNHKAYYYIRDGEKGVWRWGKELKETWCLTSTETIRLIREGGRGYGGGGRGRLYTYGYTVTTRMIPALRWAAMRVILMFQ